MVISYILFIIYEKIINYMYLKKITLKNFRNYNNIEIPFKMGNNLLIAENGMGKTNIIEAIYMLGFMKSFKPVLDKDIIKQGEDSFFLKGVFEDKNIESLISIGVSKDKKLVTYNENKIKNISSLIGILKLVIFTQDDIQLITGSPSIRRKNLDITLSLANRQYFNLVLKYRKIIKQRNNYLKKMTNDYYSRDLIKVWDEQLIETGSSIISIRKEFFNPINEITTTLYNALSFNITNFHLSYLSSIGNLSGNISIKDQLKKKLNENRDKEMFYKQTLYGPHKDDFRIRSGNTDFKRFASQGQNRAGALTLKLAMTKYIETMSDTKTILLMDDILLDLDNKKKDKFLSLVDGRQNIFTSTSLNGFDNIIHDSLIYTIKENNLLLYSN